ncbi:tetratricopeptide repeat protein [Synechococcus sp. ATX 2A4]|uniref:tetratricopeptide repeat protein n=1 Tax=Synechococcus sp. ATX 2A4 TaxID=2823727 RepID=UPI0020CC33B0|nr:tetratricopeptide repeat protein [Synechococcus sp. ATX 2A4]MCP9885129.1 tetratricopeptide repeat protein [Synechococcus sp. ATX 2A4]
MDPQKTEQPATPSSVEPVPPGQSSAPSISTDNSLFSDQVAHGLALCQSGKYEEAELIYRDMIASGIADAAVFCNLGNLCRLTSRSEEGLALLKHCTELDPTYANGFFNLGVAYQQDNDQRQAIGFYRKALSINRKHEEAIRNQGLAFYFLGRPLGAYVCFKRLFAQNPGQPGLMLDAARLDKRLYTPVIQEYQKRLATDHADTVTAYHLGVALREARRLEEAALHNAICLSTSPASVDLWLEQACCLMELHDIPQALEACQKALSLDPENARSHFLKSNCLRNSGKPMEAAQAMQHAIDLQPDFADAIVNLAINKRDQGLLEEAIDMFKRAIQLQPMHPEAWEGLIFSYSIGGKRYQDELITASAKFWALTAQAAPLHHSSANDRKLRQPTQVRRANKMRIGILSAEIGHHVVSTFLDSFLSHYNREAIEVEIIVPALRVEAGSRELISKASQLLNIQGEGVEKARELLRSRSYDILIETSGHTESNRLQLISQRCAPIQCHYIGFHATTGLKTIDYIIADHELIPEEFDSSFTETPWRINRPWLACTPYSEPPVAASAAQSLAPVWGSFGQVAKIREETLSYWSSALRAVPAATLVIKDRNTVFESVRQRILLSLKRQGVESHRVSFLPWTKTWRDHMLCHNQIDIALDTTPWSSSTTAFNALSMGVPLVAIRGQTMAARMSASIVRGLGKPEWICDTEAEFAVILAQLSSGVAALRSGKQTLQAEVMASQLFDGKDLTLHLETAFRQMIASHKG